MDTNKLYYFGYGAYRDPAKVFKILGKNLQSCQGAILPNYKLYYQSLSQIPSTTAELLKKVWGENFKAYTIDPENGYVAGVLWKISKDDLNFIKDWEFNGIWREIINVTVKTFDGKEVKAFTDKAINSNQREGSYDGLNYPNNLNTSEITTDKEKLNEDVYKIEKLRQLRNELGLITK